MKNIFIICLAAVLISFTAGCGKKTETSEKSNLAGKKAFILDSYDAAHVPNIPSRTAAIRILEDAGIQTHIFFLDTKNITDIDAIKKISTKAVKEINRIKPDIILPFDDSASKYVIMPYFKDGPIPVIFNGINWDAKQYGYPYKNATGQIEVEMVTELVASLKKYSKGNRTALLTGDTMTDRDSLKFYKDILGLTFSEVRFVKDFNSWKKSYLELQNLSDIIFIRNNSGIKNWNQTEAESFVDENIKIITGSIFTHMKKLAVINYAKDDSESGEYSAVTALKVLGGTKVSDIPITMTQHSEIILNMSLAKKLKIIFPMELIEQSRFAGE